MEYEYDEDECCPHQHCDGDTVHTEHFWWDAGDNEWYCDGIIE